MQNCVGYTNGFNSLQSACIHEHYKYDNVYNIHMLKKFTCCTSVGILLWRDITVRVKKSVDL